MAANVERSRPTSTSLGLLSALRKQDQQGWERFVELYRPIIYSWCRRGGIAEEDAADVTQQVFLRAFRGIETFRKREQHDSFRAWLATICRHVIIDHFRSQNRHPRAEGGTDARRRIEEKPDWELAELTDACTETRYLAHRALQLISDEFSCQAQKAFRLVVLEGMTSTEAASILGISAMAVRKSKSRILARVRQVLGDLE